MDYRQELLRLRLRPNEAGRGVRLSDNRVASLRKTCADALRNGVTQKEMCAILNASKSRVSRWVGDGVREAQDHTDRRLLRDGRETMHQMMWDRIAIPDTSKCWLWRGAVKRNGYGAMNYRGKTRHAHRMIYELLVGDIPEGMVVDHICNNRRCVNPHHLQIVSQSENITYARLRSEERSHAAT